MTGCVLLFKDQLYYRNEILVIKWLLYFATVPHVGSVTGRIHGPGAALVSWTLAFSGGLVVQFFEISFKKVNDTQWWDIYSLISGSSLPNSSFSIPGEFRSWIANGLEAEEYYLFRVRGMNDLGYGRYTESSDPVLSHRFGVPSPPSRPVVVGWAKDYAIFSSSIYKLGLPDAENVTVSIILMQNGAEIERQIFEVSTDYVPTSELQLTYLNLSYRGDWQFTVSCSNVLGESIPSPPSSEG